MHQLKAHGTRMSIVTGAPKHILELEMEVLRKEHFEHIIITNPRYGMPIKPNPQGLQKCISLMDITNSEAIYVGNGEEDVMTAKNAEVLDALVLRNEYHFQDPNPTIAISSLHELRPHLGMT